MNTYLSIVNIERRKYAQSCLEQLIDVQRRILQRAEDIGSYLATEREADIRSMNEAQEALTASIKAVLSIEADAKTEGLLPCRRCNALFRPEDMKGHLCIEYQRANG